MNNRGRWMVSGMAIVVVVAAVPCRADLVISTGSGYGGPQIRRYSNTGADLGSLGRYGESVDALTSAANGHVYPIGNILGTGLPYHLDAAGTVVSSDYTYRVFYPTGAAVGAGYLFVGSTQSDYRSDSLTGVLEYDATTLAFVRNAIPMSIPTQYYSAQRDLAFGDDGRLYVADLQSVARYMVNAGGTVTRDPMFSIAATGNIAVHAGSIFISDGSKLDRYNASGTLQDTFVAAGTGGLQTIRDYVFGDDGGLYVTGGATGGSQLVRFDGTTGAFQQQLRYEPYPTGYEPSLGLITYVPEPASGALLVLASAGLLKRRRPA